MAKMKTCMNCAGRTGGCWDCGYHPKGKVRAHYTLNSYANSSDEVSLWCRYCEGPDRLHFPGCPNHEQWGPNEFVVPGNEMAFCDFCDRTTERTQEPEPKVLRIGDCSATVDGLKPAECARCGNRYYNMRDAARVDRAWHELWETHVATGLGHDGK